MVLIRDENSGRRSFNGNVRWIAWESLPILAIASLTVIIFWRELIELGHAWIHDPYIRHGIIIPFISLYLFLQVRGGLEMRTQDAKMGALISVSSIPLLTAVRTYLGLFWTLIPLLLFLTGLIIMFYSTLGLKKTWFSIGYLFFMFPGPNGISAPLSVAMSNITYHLTILWLKLLDIPHQATNGAIPKICINGTGQTMNFLIDVSCVGVYALLGFMAFGFFFGYITSGSLTKRVLLIFVGAISLIILNTVRIAVILGLAAEYGEGIAVEASHFMGGWVLLALSFGIMLFLAERSKLRIGSGREVR